MYTHSYDLPQNREKIVAFLAFSFPLLPFNLFYMSSTQFKIPVG